MNSPKTPEQALAAIGLQLPALVPPIASFLPYSISGSLLYLSGKGAPARGGTGSVPKLGGELSVAQGQAFARDVALFHLAAIKQALGELSRLRKFVKVLGLVNSEPDFCEQPEVIDGYSDLMIDVFGERGRHARSAIGVASLPRGFAVEIEAIVEIET